MIASGGSPFGQQSFDRASPSPANRGLSSELGHEFKDPNDCIPELAKVKVLLQIGRVPAFSWGMIVALPDCMLSMYTVEL